MKCIYCEFDFIEGMKFQVGKEKEGIWEYLDGELENTDMLHMVVGSSTQFLAVDFYAKKHNCKLKAFIPDENCPGKLIKVQGEDLCKAHYYLNKEYIDLHNEFELFEEDRSE